MNTRNLTLQKGKGLSKELKKFAQKIITGDIDLNTLKAYSMCGGIPLKFPNDDKGKVKLGSRRNKKYHSMVFRHKSFL